MCMIDGAMHLCVCMAMSDCCIIVYADNQLGEKAGMALAEALTANDTLQHLNLSCEQRLRGRGAVQAQGAIDIAMDTRFERGSAQEHMLTGDWGCGTAQQPGKEQWGKDYTCKAHPRGRLRTLRDRHAGMQAC